MRTATTEAAYPEAADGRDDRVFPVTRWVAAAIVPILLVAFVILYFYPMESAERFAWQIMPCILGVYVGAGYVGGAYLFARVIFERRWHRVGAALPAVAAFTVSMLVLTVLHWERFDLGHFPFQVWLVIYIVTPFLIPWLWLRNRATDPGVPEPGDVIVPRAIRLGVAGLGAGLLLVSLAAFAVPSLLIGVWPWALTPLSARVVAGWLLLIGVADVVIARDARWSAWRIGVESIALWHLLVLIGAVANADEFIGGLANWYTVSVAVVLAATAVLYVSFERQRRAGVMQKAAA